MFQFRLLFSALEHHMSDALDHPQRSLKPLWVFAFFAGISALSMGCSVPTDTQQTAFRIRTDFSAGLNATDGWAGDVNEQVRVFADQPFRIRFELEAPAGEEFRLQYKRNDEAWTDVGVSDFPYPEAATPRVSIVSEGTYEPGAATKDLLETSTAPFTGGEGVSRSQSAGSTAISSGQTEWEWPLVIRRFADGAITNNEGDIFAFRMVQEEGTLINYQSIPELPLSIAPGHLGGTFVETPGRIGPWQATNGDLYFIMEPAETDNVLMMVKSEDGGRTWAEIDGPNRPTADDLEGVASVFASGVIHILHQTSDDVWYHAFNTTDSPLSPESWSTTDENAARPDEPPTQVAAIAARSDGSLVGVYGAPQKIHYKIRSPQGDWGPETVLDRDDDLVLSGPQIVTGKNDLIHLAYTGNDGSAWYRTILPDGTPTGRQLLSKEIGTTEYDVGSILPLVFLPESNTVVILYRVDPGTLWERRISGDGSMSSPVQISERLVVQNAVDSDQTGADAIGFEERVYVLFIEENKGGIYATYADQDGTWQPDALQVDNVQAQWIRGTLSTDTYTYVYDAGSNGGAGMNKFGEWVLDE